MTELIIVYRAAGDLKPAPRNARTHSKKQIEQIADSIRRFGFTNPVLLDADGRILAGHARVEAAKLLAIETVPTVRLQDMNEAERRAYVIADNRLAEFAGWDKGLLALEFEYIAELDLDFDLTLTGFETAEIDLVIEEAGVGDADREEESVPTPDRTKPAVSRTGDLWLLGDHRLFCGDALEVQAFERLMDGKAAQMVISDPPYNVPIEGHVCGSGAIKHDEFAMASGEMDEREFVAFLATALGNLAAFSGDGSIHFVFMDWRHAFEILTAGRAVYDELKNMVVWNKTNAGMGSFYRSKHELVFVFKKGAAAHINNFGLGEHGRHRSNVWDYAGVNTIREGRLEDLAMHPTVKPTALVADAIRDCSHRGGIILDGFAGSGTTIIAAEETGRIAAAIEIDPHFVDVVVGRWQAATGGTAHHAETGQSFEEMAECRSAAEPTHLARIADDDMVKGEVRDV